MNLQDKFVIDRSADHCHLTEKDAITLFGVERIKGCKKKALTIEGEFATDLKIEDFRDTRYTVLYPWREYSQLELAQSSYYKLTYKYSERVGSGELQDAKLLNVSTDHNMIGIDIPVITVKAHVHLNTWEDTDLLEILNFPFPLAIKVSKTTDGLNHIHLDTDQFAALQ